MPPNPRVSTEVWFLNNWGAAGGETDDLTNEATNTPSLTSAEAGSEGGSGSGSQFLGEATAETLTNSAESTQTLVESEVDAITNSATNTPNLNVAEVDTGGSVGSGSQNLSSDATAETLTNSAESTQTLDELELTFVADTLRNFGGQYLFYESFDAPLDYSEWYETEEFAVSGGALIFEVDTTNVPTYSFIEPDNWTLGQNDTHLVNNPPFTVDQEVVFEFGDHTILDDDKEHYFEFGVDGNPYYETGASFYFVNNEFDSGLWVVTGSNPGPYVQADLPEWAKIVAEGPEDVFYIKNAGDPDWTEVFRGSRIRSDHARDIFIFGNADPPSAGFTVEIRSLEVRQRGNPTNSILESSSELVTNSATNTPHLNVSEVDTGGSVGSGSQSASEAEAESPLNSAESTQTLDEFIGVFIVDTIDTSAEATFSFDSAEAEDGSQTGTGSFVNLEAEAESPRNSAESTQSIGEDIGLGNETDTLTNGMLNTPSLDESVPSDIVIEPPGYAGDDTYAYGGGPLVPINRSRDQISEDLDNEAHGESNLVEYIVISQTEVRYEDRIVEVPVEVVKTVIEKVYVTREPTGGEFEEVQTGERLHVIDANTLSKELAEAEARLHFVKGHNIGFDKAVKLTRAKMRR